ncbi:MAG: alpha-amylase family glycosyl hydrolase, partial [Saprospiraceae bacterium]
MKYLTLLLGFLYVSCEQSNPLPTIPEWTKNSTIYEIMPRQYSETKNLKGITLELDRIKSFFFNTIVILPLFERDEAGNAFNPVSPFALKSFNQIDPNLGKDKDLEELIDSVHSKGLKILMEWNLSVTGPNHPWRIENPEYYKSDTKIIDKRYNQDYIKLNLENKSLQSKLYKSYKDFFMKFKFDGVVLYDCNLYPSDFLNKIQTAVNRKDGFALMEHSSTITNGFHYHSNSGLYQRFQKIDSEGSNIDELNIIVDSCSNIPLLNYVQDNLINERHGSDVNAFYNTYKYFHTLTFFLPGIQWILNGQEGPQFERISIFSSHPFSRQYKFNNDFYRSMAMQKFKNPALWNLDTTNLPVRISNSKEV